MLEPRFIRENPELIRQALKDRNSKFDIEAFFALDREWRASLQKIEELKQKKNEASKKIGEMIKAKQDPAAAKAEVGGISSELESMEKAFSGIDEKYSRLLEFIPNVPHESVPVGKSAEDNKVVKEHGEIPRFSFKPKDHTEIGRMNGLFDLERGAKISGSGFILYTGQGAKLERALINFMLDVHTAEHGYKEIFPPYLVNRKSMRGTGQIPNLEEDMYRLKDEDLFLIPTAEVPVTNIHADEVLKEEDLPVRYAAFSGCFRREAGSYGKDTKGLIRVHQFNKVELVKFAAPEKGMEELEKLLLDAEEILKRLGLPYRVLALCTGDMSFAAHKCYDIELWAPGTGRWLEVSSCSVFSDFQARRANIKYQPSDKTLKPRMVFTLNGSGVALPRLVISILENYQDPDGSVTVPEALRPYFGKDKIVPQAC